MNKEDQALLLSPYLTAYFNRRDNALAFIQPSFMTRQAASYLYVKYQEVFEAVTTESVKLGMLKGIRQQIKGLLKKAKGLHDHELRRIGAQIEWLYQQAERLNG